MGPEGSPCTPLRALREWCYIVPWTPLIKNQDVNNRYFGSHPPFWTFFNEEEDDFAYDDSDDDD